MTKEYITFGDNGKGRVLSVGTVKVSESMTLQRVSLVKSLGYNLLSISQLLDQGFEVHSKRVVLVFWILEAISCARSSTIVAWFLVFRQSLGNGIGD
jgi:hypothetical protein